MKAADMWEAFKKQTPEIEDPFFAWQFGVAPDELAALVLNGEKTATCSSYPLYAIDNELLPEVGTYHIILNSQDEAVCVICLTKVTIMKFCEVTPEHAFKEGEGDKSYAYWRGAHEAFFLEELATYDLNFTSEMEVVCEEFKVVYKVGNEV